MLALEVYPEIILAIAALLTAVAGVLSAWAAMKRSGSNATKTAEENCLQRLRDARAESEQYAKDLHDTRIKEALG